ncbi:hypothetical protein D3C75_780510 [compost metagenome]
MHRNHQLRTNIQKGLNGLLRGHMLRAHEPFRLIGTDRHQRHMQLEAPANLLEARKKAAVPGKIKIGRQLAHALIPLGMLRGLSRLQHKAAPVGGIGIERRPPRPVLRRHKGQLHRPQCKLLPPLHFETVRKTFAYHLAFQPHRHHKRGSRSVQLPDGSEMQVIVMGMGDQNQIHGRNPAERNAGPGDALLKPQTLCPYRICDNINPFILKQKS